MYKTLATKLATLAVGAAGLIIGGIASAQSVTLPATTVLPVRFVHSIDAKKAKVGDVVKAKLMQVVVLPSGSQIAEGSIVMGHITAVEPFRFDTTPYAHQKPSTVSIHFDKVEKGAAEIPVSVSVRAMAGSINSQEAAFPHHDIDTETLGTIVLIGGTSYSPLAKSIESEDGDAIAYNRGGHLFARLQSATSSTGGSFTCPATSTEQSMAIYSPNACGLYGFQSNFMPESGRDGSGTFTLATRGHSALLPAGSTALLQVN